MHSHQQSPGHTMNKTTDVAMTSLAPHTAAAGTRHVNQVPNQHSSLATKQDKAQERELKILFPWTLHSLLEDAEKEGFDSTVSWRPSGIAFKVHKRDDFMNEVLPRYFRQTKFKSFVRQLNLWGFSCIDQGPDKGAYHNKAFVRGNADLCKEMRRTKVKKLANPPSNKPVAATHFPVHSYVRSAVAESSPTPYSPHTHAHAHAGPNSMRPSVLDPPPQIGVYSVNNNNNHAAAHSSSIGESINNVNGNVGGETLEQHTHISPIQILSRAYAQASTATATPNARNNNNNNNLGAGRESGDWLDKLEAAICPTTSSTNTAPPLGLTDSRSWMRLLEPRPIRPAKARKPPESSHE